jgi:hypothetical protein
LVFFLLKELQNGVIATFKEDKKAENPLFLHSPLRNKNPFFKALYTT